METQSHMFFPPSSAASSLAFAKLMSSQQMVNSPSFVNPDGSSYGSGSSGLKRELDLTHDSSGKETSPQASENEVKSCRRKIEKKIKKPRYAFQTRSQVDILDDGYRWRKYGQKAVKNNRFPRSYYRCTHQGCTVKKQVQSLSIDEGVVVTTYEGMHTHPIEKSTENFEHILNQMQIYST